MNDLSQWQIVTTTTYGWRLERRDGIALGFTSHDRDIATGGLLYRASPGMLPSSIVQSEGLDTGGLDVSGALQNAAITEADLRAGRWDRAALTIFLIDWMVPSETQQILAAGEIGGVSYSAGKFEAEFLGPAALLSAAIVPTTSPSCRASFCDSDCSLNVRRFRHDSKVVSADGETITLSEAPIVADSSFAFGQLRWMTGPNTGLISDIVDSNGVEIRLADSAPFMAADGDRVTLTQGCDKVMATCSARFGNAINFRGEPYLPGNDILTRYPGA
ncbi:MAG: DUF2163 domain-containing protein [Sphingorhabdus sp.]